MTVPQLVDVNHYGNSIINPVLQSSKFGNVPSSPVAGHFYVKDDGLLYYRNPSNVELPVGENGIVSISGMGGITATQNGRSTVIAVADATASQKGVLSPEFYSLLAGAGSANTPNSLIERDANGSFSAGVITAGNLVGLSTTPPTPDSAVSAAYLQSIVTGIQQSVAGRDFKDRVDVAMTTNVPLTSGAGTYDGISLGVGESLALLNQTNPVENGVYQVTSTGLVRRADSSTAVLMHVGAVYPVAEGTLAARLIMVQTPASYTLGTDAISLVALDDSVLAGDGLEKTGRVVSAVGAAGRIAVNASNIDIDSTYVGQASITTLGTLTTGIWNANEIALAHGGTGATTADQALTNLGAQQETNPFVLGDGTATSFTITGSWNNPYPSVDVWFQGQLLSPGAVEITTTGNNSLTITAKQGSTPIPSNSLTVVIKAKKLS